MSLSYVNFLYRPKDIKLGVVLDDYKKAINNIVDEVNSISAASGTTASGLISSFNADYFEIFSGKIAIKNYYDTSYPLNGGGTLAAKRTLSLLYYSTDLDVDASHQLYVKDSGIDHDATTNFVADEHIAHSGVTITAGTGLTGGGDISTSRTISLSHLGIESLADPNADKIMFWDDSETAMKWLGCDGTSIGITGTSLAVIPGGVDHGGLAGLTDDDHAHYILASGTRPLTGNWDVGAFEVRAETFYSDVLTGVAPLTVSSVTLCTNLNADLWDGHQFADYLDQSVGTTSSPTFAKVTIASNIGHIATNSKASVMRSTDQTINAGAGDVVIQFDSENYDPNNNYDSTVNFRYTCPIAGMYYCALNVTWNNVPTTSWFWSAIRINGARASSSCNGGIAYPSCNTAILLSCAAGTLVDCIAGHSDGSNQAILGGQAYTNFSVALVSQNVI